MFNFRSGDIVRVRGLTGYRIIHHYNRDGCPYLIGARGGWYDDDRDIECVVGRTDAFEDRSALPELMAAARVVFEELSQKGEKS
jgi:hypothetical protein